MGALATQRFRLLPLDREAQRHVVQRARRAGPRASTLALWWAARIAAILGDRDRAVALYRQRFVQSGAGVGTHMDNRDIASLLDYPPFLALVAAMRDG
jgi:hypothetical protein